MTEQERAVLVERMLVVWTGRVDAPSGMAAVLEVAEKAIQTDEQERWTRIADRHAARAKAAEAETARLRALAVDVLYLSREAVNSDVYVDELVNLLMKHGLLVEITATSETAGEGGWLREWPRKPGDLIYVLTNAGRVALENTIKPGETQ